MIENLLLSLDYLLNSITDGFPEIAKDIKKGASLLDLNEKYKLKLPTWHQLNTPLLSLFSKPEKKLFNENLELKQKIDQLKMQMNHLQQNKDNEICEILDELKDLVIQCELKGLSDLVSCAIDKLRQYDYYNEEDLNTD